MYLKRTEYFDKEGKLQGNKYKFNWGAGPNLGATRPRVGICKSRLEALTYKYMNITNSSIASLGHRTPSWQCRRGDASPPG